MFKLRVVQAEYGDCLILEYGSSTPRYILIDGGPPSVYDNYLQKELINIRDSGGKIEIAVLSHVDEDHVVGLLDLLSDIMQQQADRKKIPISIEALWHNSFGETIGEGTDIEKRLTKLIENAGTVAGMLVNANMKVEGIGEGNWLRQKALALKIPINQGFTKSLICVDYAPNIFTFDNLSLQVVGPTKQNLAELKNKWKEWLDKNENKVASADSYVAAMTDKSVPNLSSIMFLAQADGKSILLTGDGRGDYLIQGLAKAGLLNNSSLHVDVLKVPHHGSDRDVTKNFFKTITADKYVISANGKYDNPDLSTMIWIIEAAKEQGRPIDIFVTNETPSTQKLVEEYNPTEYKYKMTTMKRSLSSFTLDVTA